MPQCESDAFLHICVCEAVRVTQSPGKWREIRGRVETTGHSVGLKKKKK